MGGQQRKWAVPKAITGGGSESAKCLPFSCEEKGKRAGGSQASSDFAQGTLGKGLLTRTRYNILKEFKELKEISQVYLT